ncbi:MULTISPECIES: hypothetical protein [Microbacterium]|uniref:hypothetical protein n=1 Tax=Microbacterium TaxID=33882 RepID=UPI002781386B|nr:MULTISPECIES: hypothetical protein [Microbacterium]MDQ1084848.1 hypothetical protein [Microbacterium sp. SORGH_AS_0344]MDQ1169872.1 hypothetical protein [Microbacterium proteolyticum]
MNETKPLGAGAWVAIGIGIGLVAVTAIVQFVILMAGVLGFGVLGLVLVSNYTETPSKESPATGLAGEWILDPTVADVSVHIDADGFVALEDWPVDLLCPAADQTFRDAEDLDWSRTMTVSGIAETDERVATIDVLLDPVRPGCTTWLEFSVKGEPASSDVRLVLAPNGLDDVFAGVEPLVFQRIDPADAANPAVHTATAGVLGTTLP